MRATLDVIGSIGFYLSFGLAFILPVMCLAATAIFYRPDKFGRCGSQTSRRWLVAAIIFAWIIVALQFALMEYMTERYSHGYGLGIVLLEFYFIPAVITSVLMFFVCLRHALQQQ